MVVTLSSEQSQDNSLDFYIIGFGTLIVIHAKACLIYQIVLVDAVSSYSCVQNSLIWIDPLGL